MRLVGHPISPITRVQEKRWTASSSLTLGWPYPVSLYWRWLTARRSCANSLIVAVLTAIPAILTALTHFLLNYLAHQGDCQWSRDHTNNPPMRLLHTSKLSFIIVCQWNIESLASLVFGRPICWSWACYFSEFFLTKCWDTPMLFGDRSEWLCEVIQWRHRLVLFYKMSNVFYYV